MDIIDNIFNTFNKFFAGIWFYNISPFKSVDLPLIIGLLLFGCLYFMIALRFVNIRYIFSGFKMLLNSGSHGAKDGISSFKALFSSIAGAAGLGNIAGIAFGVSIGGPGVILWVLVAAFLCMPLRFAEIYLGHKYRKKGKNGFFGGPFVYIKDGLASLGFAKFGGFLASIYCICLIFGTFGGPSSFQVNQAVKLIHKVFEISETGKIVASITITSIAVFVILGGIQRISSYCSSTVIFLMSCYTILAIGVVLTHYDKIPHAVSIIIEGAFNAKAISGGVFSVFITSFRRIVLANETGFGTAPTMHANSNEENSVKEAIIGMICPLIDCVFVCMVTGIIIVFSGYHENTSLSGILVIEQIFHDIHPFISYFLTVFISLMAINLMIAWSYYGYQNVESLFKTKKFNMIYISLFAICSITGGLIEDFGTIILFTDIVNFAVVFPNIIAIMMLSKQVIKGYNNFIKK